MNIRQFEYFVQICDNKSFSKTAQKAYITTQALSKAIKNLEDELAVTLFERKAGTGISITKEGQYLYEKCREPLEIYHRFKQEVFDHFKVKNNSLRLGITTGATRSISPVTFFDFQENHEDISLSVFNGSDAACEEGLLNREYDIACMGRPINQEELLFVPVLKEKFCAVVHEKNMYFSRNTLSLAQLQKENLICSDAQTNAHRIIVERCRKKGFEPKFVYTSLDVDFLKMMSVGGKGILISPEHVTNGIQHPNISVVPIDEEDFVWEVGFVVRKDTKISFALREFIDHTFRALQMSPPDLLLPPAK